MITVAINGKKITLERPMTILDASASAGIKIPTLCHHEMLEPYGGCRLCIVEVEKMPRLQTSCTQYVTDGMVIWTETERVVAARKAMLEMLLINHPLDCPYCDKAGECDLQDLVVKYGPPTGRFMEGKRTHSESFDDPIIVRNIERCILCARCVRMCDEVQGASAISITNRSSKSFVEPFSGGRYDCEYCGNCLTVCPVGAIMSRLHRHSYRPWLIEKEVCTVCSFCGVGCTMVAQVRSNSIIRVAPKSGRGLNKGLLCSMGRFGYDYISSKNRLKTPLIRKDGDLSSATWSEAFSYIASKLKAIKDSYGADSIAGIASGRCTNEDGYIFQKFMRISLGSNNIDSIASLAFAPAQRFFENMFGQGVTANPVSGISKSDGIFVIGGDPVSINPVLGLQVRAAYRKGIPVITAGYAEGLKMFRTRELISNTSTEPTLLASLISELMTRGRIPLEKSILGNIMKEFRHVSLEEAERICGVVPSEIVSTIDILEKMTNPAIIIGSDIIRSSEGNTNLFLLAVLTYLLNGRIYLLSGLPNEQGLVDMGCLPDMLPGGRPLTVDSFRKRYEEFFDVKIPSAPGLNIVEIMEGACSGKIKAIYVMGDDGVINMWNDKHAEDFLSRLELLVVQDIFMTNTARLADVVLPSLAWAEKEGSYTNLERRMQFLKKAVDGNGMEDWRAIAEVSRMLGFDMNYRNSRDVMSEIAKVSPLHKDVTYGDMTDGEFMWPYKGEPLRHGIGIQEVEISGMQSLMKIPDKGRMLLSIDNPLFYTETLIRNSAALSSIAPEQQVRTGRGHTGAEEVSV